MNAEKGFEPTVKSFAELMSSFNKLTEMESRIEAAIENSKIPWTETRKFLKGIELNQVINTPLSQFFCDLFKEIGLGPIELTEKKNYQYIYRIHNCPVCGLFKDVQDRKVCQPTADAISRFFGEDMGLEGEVKETKCMNINDEYCEFKMELQPFTVLEKALDNIDLEILDTISGNGISGIQEISDKLELDEDELRARVTLLKYYEILNENNQITEVGKTFYKYRLNNPFEEEEPFEPPWRSMAELTSTIAATQSFAEALVVVTEEEKLPWEADDAELMDMRERAKDKTSFAELLSAEVKKSTDEDDEE
jgi:predicted hydrocarbon binding protein